ncbi:hypothetical protein KIN20_023670 [Parelaphostrongylus tenuis]|uniref:Uncharacterized protein n=1 Tax=Parelaphostrongylus tenuis TaxID=148309 RepID=A0AAD5MVZ2_PARTN|nr:hypothetical protein KIN20_023670 [Parelaphostrongylus tenuis]
MYRCNQHHCNCLVYVCITHLRWLSHLSFSTKIRIAFRHQSSHQYRRLNHPAVIHSGSSASSAASSASGVVPPATSPATVPVTPTSMMPNVHRNITNSGGNFLQQNSMSYTG